MDHIEASTALLHDGMEKFILQEEGSINKYLGVSIMQLDDLSFDLTQHFSLNVLQPFLVLIKAK
jgi:hypothetical protein